jgi:DNA-binding NtrC family response regulator
VRELQNAVERAVILSDGETIQPAHLNLQAAALTPAAAPDPWDAIDLGGSLADVLARTSSEVERRKVALALKESGGDRVRAADALQVGYKALQGRIKDLGLDKG